MDTVRLENRWVTLEPLGLNHVAALESAAADGNLWDLWFTSVPAPGRMTDYVEAALRGQEEGRMSPWVVRENGSGQIVGCTRYYDIVPDPSRLAIGYTWYARRWQRSHVNTATKHLLLSNAFQEVGAVAVEFHTDAYNQDSQRAIERLGAKREGILRAHKRRNDGSLRDTVCYSILATEWPDVDRWLQHRLRRLAPAEA
ncbi:MULTISPECIES: GNAT family protein [unclassified Luteibacter]|uniref:GNAT family N-acetyltransferase n=1 Tax=unclassified Luteibacter TaxID=2620188 RepID=UPI0008C68E62|nr:MULTISPECIES: GNAT family protein [unclassified Luteibacter]MDR6937927.1 RimJ/RimL family protein N-acetyltransferase [Luteibacter sp. 3190]SEW21240.1 Protein N-acetyltransferase, RimJ/RimL family [Luteibacter sp. 329MFSha]